MRLLSVPALLILFFLGIENLYSPACLLRDVTIHAIFHEPAEILLLAVRTSVTSYLILQKEVPFPIVA